MTPERAFELLANRRENPPEKRAPKTHKTKATPKATTTPMKKKRSSKKTK
jgi:topoisomerase IA-like protein